MLPQFQAAGVKVMVVTVASPQKAAEFVSAQQELPLDAVFCSADLAAYRALGFYDNFGAALGARNAAIVPLEKIRSRGEQGLKSMQDSVKNFGKVISKPRPPFTMGHDLQAFAALVPRMDSARYTRLPCFFLPVVVSFARVR